jgi:hypothetical protein
VDREITFGTCKRSNYVSKSKLIPATFTPTPRTRCLVLSQ